jgi:hypothetical protein
VRDNGYGGQMKLGFSIPQCARLAADAGQTARFARELEAAGAASLWVGDRLFAAVDPKMIGALVRVNVARGDAPQAVIDDIKRVADALGFEHFFIEQMYADDTVDQAITSAVAFLDRARR